MYQALLSISHYPPQYSDSGGMEDLCDEDSKRTNK